MTPQSTPRAPTSSVYFGALLLLLVILTGLLGYYLWLEFPDIGTERSLASNLGLVLLINLNIIAVMVLAFLVTKNIITLVLDRRRNILGSRLRTRLVTAFVGLSLIPTVLLFLVAKGILESVLQGWLSPQIAASVDGALNVAKFHSHSEQERLARQARLLGEQFASYAPVLSAGSLQSNDWARSAALRALLRSKREEHGLAALAVVDEKGEALALATAGLDGSGGTDEPVPAANLRAIQRANGGTTVVRPEHAFSAEYLRAYAPIRATGPPGPHPLAPGLVLVATESISPELGTLLSSVITAYEDYSELRTYRRPLASTYLLTLVVVTLLIVFAAIWVGFYLAKSLSIPIGSLAKATDQVAHGNLDYQIPEVGDDELSVLVRSFNTMTADLKATTAELVARRRYMEAVFANVAVGVLSVDRELNIRAINLAAQEMLDLPENENRTHRHVAHVLPEELSKQVCEMTDSLFNGVEKTVEANVSIHVREQPRHLLVTITKLTDDGGKTIGSVVLLDDLTELVSAQRMAAWREVARRIAHEIKNPLTPIQLCAERMQRRFSAKPPASGTDADRGIILECTDIIVKQVENLRTLVNEFSGFARMPKSSPRSGDMNDLLTETASIYRQAHSDVAFSLLLDPTVPTFDFDREQLSRALINLLDNAVASVLSASELGTGIGTAGEKAVTLTTHFDPGLELVTITVNDTGIGISDRDKPKLFEPYFTTKRGGTGLGLAIVSAIVSDHHGFVRVRDNKPQGASFVIELPIVRQQRVANDGQRAG